MKILIVTQGYYPAIGGTEWMVQQLSEQLVRQFDDEVTVFTTNCLNGEGFFTPGLPRLPVGAEKINGVLVRRFAVASRLSRLLRLPQSVAYHLGLPGNQYLRALAGGPIVPGLAQAIRSQDCDVILASSFPLLHMFITLRAAQQVKRPCVLVGGLHPEDRWGFQRPAIYQAIAKADRYVAYTDYEARHVIDHGTPASRVSVVGLGSHPERYTGISSEEARRRLGLSGEPLVGYIGQLGGHKGVDTLVKAMPRVWEVIPETHFLIAGARTLFLKELQSLVSRFSASQQQRIIWVIDFPEQQKAWLFGAVDVFAYPSGFESFGIAFLEAWISGKPVVGCRRGAIPWVVTAGRDGLLVPYHRAGPLAEALLLLLQNPAWARAMGEAGRRKVQDSYTWAKVASRFREVFSQFG